MAIPAQVANLLEGIPTVPSSRRRAAAVVGALHRHHGPDDPRLADARRDLRAAELEEHVRRIVAEAPPLTDDQRSRIAALLRPAAPAATSNVA